MPNQCKDFHTIHVEIYMFSLIKVIKVIQLAVNRISRLILYLVSCGTIRIATFRRDKNEYRITGKKYYFFITI